MDMKPTLLPQSEHQARKARDLRKRGYTDAEIADALGVSPAKIGGLIGAPAKSTAKPAPAVAAKVVKPKPAARPRAG